MPPLLELSPTSNSTTMSILAGETTATPDKAPLPVSIIFCVLFSTLLAILFVTFIAFCVRRRRIHRLTLIASESLSPSAPSSHLDPPAPNPLISTRPSTSSSKMTHFSSSAASVFSGHSIASNTPLIPLHSAPSTPNKASNHMLPNMRSRFSTATLEPQPRTPARILASKLKLKLSASPLKRSDSGSKIIPESPTSYQDLTPLPQPAHISSLQDSIARDLTLLNTIKSSRSRPHVRSASSHATTTTTTTTSQPPTKRPRPLALVTSPSTSILPSPKKAYNPSSPRDSLSSFPPSPSKTITPHRLSSISASTYASKSSQKTLVQKEGHGRSYSSSTISTMSIMTPTSSFPDPFVDPLSSPLPFKKSSSQIPSLPPPLPSMPPPTLLKLKMSHPNSKDLIALLVDPYSSFESVKEHVHSKVPEGVEGGDLVLVDSNTGKVIRGDQDWKNVVLDGGVRVLSARSESNKTTSIKWV